MKITIEPTTDQSGNNYKHCCVSIAHQEDDLIASEALELVKAALIAWGYHPSAVAHIIEE